MAMNRSAVVNWNASLCIYDWLVAVSDCIKPLPNWMPTVTDASQQTSSWLYWISIVPLHSLFFKTVDAIIATLEATNTTMIAMHRARPAASCHRLLLNCPLWLSATRRLCLPRLFAPSQSLLSPPVRTTLMTTTQMTPWTMKSLLTCGDLLVSRSNHLPSELKLPSVQLCSLRASKSPPDPFHATTTMNTTANLS